MEPNVRNTTEYVTGVAKTLTIRNSMTVEKIEREGYEVPVAARGSRRRSGWSVLVEGMDDAQMDAMTEFLSAHGLRARRKLVRSDG